jgi:hypothetical protein
MAISAYASSSDNPTLFWIMVAAFVCLCLCIAVRVVYSVFEDVGLTK